MDNRSCTPGLVVHDCRTTSNDTDGVSLCRVVNKTERWITRYRRKHGACRRRSYSTCYVTFADGLVAADWDKRKRPETMIEQLLRDRWPRLNPIPPVAGTRTADPQTNI